jgi:hypothetical protein
MIVRPARTPFPDSRPRTGPRAQPSEPTMPDQDSEGACRCRGPVGGSPWVVPWVVPEVCCFLRGWFRPVGGSRGLLLSVGGSRGLLLLAWTAARRRGVTALKTHRRGAGAMLRRGGSRFAADHGDDLGDGDAAGSRRTDLNPDRSARGAVVLVVTGPSQAWAAKGSCGGKAPRGNMSLISRARWRRRRTPARKASTNAR